MLRPIVASIALLFCGIAQAGEAGRVVFVDGDARVSGKPVTLGDVVNEGDLIQTGIKGHLYIKTIDKGFFILRPSSTGRVVAYQVDAQNPANTRIKLEVDQGVARHISGEAVKDARQNFRMNTPVAAIGVRGTDFTVFTTQDTSRVAVLSGGVVVSPLSEGCKAAGFGPCEGALSKELFASQTGQVLQVSRGQQAVQMLQGSKNSPDNNAPPKGDESKLGNPAGKDGSPRSSNDIDYSPVKSGAISQFSRAVPDTPITPPTTAAPLVWGRWEAVLGQDKQLDVAALQQTHNLVATNAYYALMRSKEGTWQRPQQDTMSFALQSAQAVITDEATRGVTPASVSNASLQLNFAHSTFATQFDLTSQNSERFKMQSQGQIEPNGTFSATNQFALPNNMNVQGAINQGNASAAYLFSSRLDDRRVTNGVTYWTR